MAVHNIVIVGASFSGLSASHYLLRHTIPALESSNKKSTTYKVILISPSSHFFWKIGAPRILASPDLIPFSKAFVPVEDGFKEYSSDRFSLVLGSATGLDESQKTLSIKPLAPHSTTSVSYDSLIIATGRSSASALWTLQGSHEETQKEMQALHKALPNASSILIGGGGPSGTETAGEIGTLYPNAEKTILSGGAHLLSRLRPAIGADAQSKLAKLGVKTIHKVRVTSATNTSAGQTTLKLSDGTTKTVDIYIDASGGGPNTSFLPRAWLNESGFVETDPKTMRATATKGVYAYGDVASYSTGSILDINDAVRPLCSSIRVDLSSDASNVPKQLEFVQKSLKETQIIPVGPKGGVGAVFGWRVPSLMVWAVKSRTFMVDMAPGAVAGKDYIKA